MKKLFIISNESIYKNGNKYFCDNLDGKSTPEELNKKFEVNLIARKSRKERAHEININNIKIFASIFSFLSEVIISTKNNNAKYLFISISPYTFLACIFLKIFKKTPIVYLRSDGYKEYKAVFGFIGPIIYNFMFKIVSKFSNLISCREYILRNEKGKVVSPSQLDKDWFINTKKEINSKDLKLLYVGRLRVEKGIFSLLELIKDSDDIFLTIVGAEKNSLKNIIQKNVSIYQTENNKDKLINFYDNHKIFILPSFTEGHPMVLLEALARLRPVLIFEEIQHVIGDKKGIFVSKRNSKNLMETIKHISSNYHNIQEEMKQNKLPTKKDFIDEMENYISFFD